MMAALLGISMLFGLGGCAGNNPPALNPESIEGGTVTNKTDYDAPKEIQSREITEFDTTFVSYTRWKTDDRDHRFHFTVKADADGTLIASEEELGVSRPADEALLSAVQEVIERNGLAAMNGVYRVTAGVDPDFGEGGMTVRYASGETLRFTDNNNPYALWSEELYDVFAAWFADRGEDALYPPAEGSRLESVLIRLIDGDSAVSYGPVNVPAEQAVDGETHLFRKEIESPEGNTSACVLFPEDFYETVAGIIEQYQLERRYDFSRFNHNSNSFDQHDLGYFGMGSMGPADGEADSEELSLTLHLKYESGKRINIDTRKESEIEAFRPLLSELSDYFDSLA